MCLFCCDYLFVSAVRMSLQIRLESYELVSILAEINIYGYVCVVCGVLCVLLLSHTDCVIGFFCLFAVVSGLCLALTVHDPNTSSHVPASPPSHFHCILSFILRPLLFAVKFLHSYFACLTQDIFCCCFLVFVLSLDLLLWFGFCCDFRCFFCLHNLN